MVAPGRAEFLPVTPLIAVHVLDGLVAVVAGVVAMRTLKGSRAHRRAGLVYLGALLLLTATAIILVLQDPARRWHLAVLGILALVLATVGYLARLHRSGEWKVVHIGGMAGSYMAMLSAFYVDNGPRLPFWRVLPTALLLIVPWLIGVPVTLRAIGRHRASRRAARSATSPP